MELSEEDVRLLGEIERNIRFDRYDAGRFLHVVAAMASVFLLIGCAHRAPDLRPSPPNMVEAHLDAFPPITISGHVVTLHAWLQDPGDVVGCPSLEWIYPDGARSFRAFDCEEAEPFEGKSDTRRVRVWRGELHFRVTFAAFGRAWSAERTVPVQ